MTWDSACITGNNVLNLVNHDFISLLLSQNSLLITSGACNWNWILKLWNDDESELEPIINGGLEEFAIPDNGKANKEFGDGTAGSNNG